ncbi:hypothetical protein [Nocardia sp. NPDC051570]|uniref:hypothetical protein n=1 Tax=Nocardia sp. NPDC051570 TaxID=3364324 RepID=UPI003791039B
MSDFAIDGLDEREMAMDLARVINGKTCEEVTYEAEGVDFLIIVTATVGGKTKKFELSVTEVDE